MTTYAGRHPDLCYRCDNSVIYSLGPSRWIAIWGRYEAQKMQCGGVLRLKPEDIFVSRLGASELAFSMKRECSSEFLRYLCHLSQSIRYTHVVLRQMLPERIVVASAG